MHTPEEEWFGSMISRGGAREFGFGAAIGNNPLSHAMPATALMNIKKRKEWSRDWRDQAVMFLERFGWIPCEIHVELMLSDSDRNLKRYARMVDESKVRPAIPEDLLMKIFLEEKSNWNNRNYRSPLLCHSDSTQDDERGRI